MKGERTWASKSNVVAQDIFADNGVLNEWADLHAGAIRSLIVSDMVHQLTARAGTRKIGWLRIFGHGAPGAQWVGQDLATLAPTVR
jgi:hypothetical protein